VFADDQRFVRQAVDIVHDWMTRKGGFQRRDKQWLQQVLLAPLLEVFPLRQWQDIESKRWGCWG
jgi:hypothetical protein